MKLKSGTKSVLVALPLLLSVQVSQGDESELAVNLKRLSLETMQKIATATIAECRKRGIQITVAVVDRYGELQVQLRDTLAPPVSIELSRMKAYTAANFTASTSQLKRQSESPIGRVPGLVMSAGGVPILAGGNHLGAIGVSGAPEGETDEECAQAGLNAVIDDLEMDL